MTPPAATPARTPTPSPSLTPTPQRSPLPKPESSLGLWPVIGLAVILTLLILIRQSRDGG